MLERTRIGGTELVSAVPVILGGTGKTSWTANGIAYASGTTTLANSANLTYDGSTAKVTGTNTTAGQWVIAYDSSHAVVFTAGAGGALGITPQAGSGVNFALSTTGDFTVNSTHLYVDTSTGRVGVGAVPSYKFHVTGTTTDSQLVITDGTSTNLVGSFGNLASYLGSGTDDSFLIASYGTRSLIFATNANQRLTIDGNGHVMPTGQGTQNLGNESTYWADISYKTITDRGCLGWFDAGVQLQDGRWVSDLEAICSIQMHPTKRTVYDTPMLDYASLPRPVYRPATRAGVALPRDERGEPYWVDDEGNRRHAADGAEMSSLISIMLGALKEIRAALVDVQQTVARLTKDAA